MFCKGVAWGPFVLLSIAVILVPSLSASAQPASAASAALAGSLQKGPSGQDAFIGRTADGYVRFIVAPPDGAFSANPGAKSGGSDAIAKAFMDDYRGAFGVANPRVEFTAPDEKTADDRTYVKLRQTYGGVPVFGARILVQLKGGDRVVNVLSDVMRERECAAMEAISLTPALDAAAASETAVHVKTSVKAPKGSLIAGSEPDLVVYSPEVVGGKGRPALAWRITVISTISPLVKELVLVDAHHGKVVMHYALIHEARSRSVYDAYDTDADPGTLVRSEGGPAASLAEANDAYNYLGNVYDFYWNEHGRDSINGLGMPLSATVRYCDPFYVEMDLCPMQNAFWSGERMYFGVGFAVDDVVGHELTHGVTDYTSNLIYANESGAINESFSDMWGEFIDLTNGLGTDTPEVRWIMGEDIPGDGMLRSMVNPPAFGDPDSYSSPNYYHGQADGGGVHTNSGVGNKLCFLLSDGGTFKNRIIVGMGISQAADLFYEAQSHLLTESSDYADFYAQLKQAAINLGLSQAQRDNLEQACRAVEIGGLPDPVSNLMPETVENDPNVTLNWTNPAKAFVNVVIRRKEGGYPADPTDGVAVYTGAAATATDGPLTVGTRYYYCAWAYHGTDEFGVPYYSLPARAIAKAGYVPPNDYYAELFDFYADEYSDLSNTSLTFRPTADRNKYSAETETASAFPVDPAGSTPLSLDDDDHMLVTLSGGKTIPFYGQSYSSFYVVSNGFVSFTEPDDPFAVYDFESHFLTPRISGISDDLDPSSGGTVSWKQLPDRAVVTFNNVPLYGYPDLLNSFQIEMYFEGKIVVTYLGLDAASGMSGLSLGDDTGTPYNFTESDLSSYVAPDADGDGISDVVEGTVDTDGDSTPDYQDTDSDDDGINDVIEGEEDTDDDGVANFRDTDSDDDDIGDTAEGDEDADGDGRPNYIDLDSDGDSLPDSMETDADVDGDGRPNYIDTDSDDDHVSDSDERTFGSDPYDAADTVDLPLAGTGLALSAAMIALAARRTIRAGKDGSASRPR